MATWQDGYFDGVRDYLQKKRDGWVKCPMCDGFGRVWNRYNYSARECPMCKGKEWLSPEFIVKQKNKLG